MDARKALPETNATSHTQESGMRLQHSTRLGRGRSKHEWPPWRKRLAECLESRRFDALLGMVVLSNVIVMCIEVDRNADCGVDECIDRVGRTISVLNLLYTLFYTAECILRMFAYRSQLVQDHWNILDLCIVIVSWLEQVISLFDALQTLSEQIPFNINFLRLFRVARLFRATRILEVFPELHMMITGVFRAMMAMFWGFIMILCLVLLWAILAVELIHPLNKHIAHDDDWCQEAFGSVPKATLIFFQTMVAGDSWGHCTISIINKHPATFLVFASALISVQLGFMNLILSVIVDSASKAREELKEEQAQKESSHHAEYTAKLLDLLESIDTDGSGALSYEELHEGYLASATLRGIVGQLGLQQEDLRLLFDVMDTDRSGAISYHEFIRYISNVQNTEQLQQHLLLARLFKRRDSADLGDKSGLGVRSQSGRSVRSATVQSPVGINTANFSSGRTHKLQHSNSGTNCFGASSGSPPRPARGSTSDPEPAVERTQEAPKDELHELAQIVCRRDAQFSNSLALLMQEFDVLSQNVQHLATSAAVAVGEEMHQSTRQYFEHSHHLAEGPSPGAALKSARGPRNAQSLWPRPAGGDIDGPGNGSHNNERPNPESEGGCGAQMTPSVSRDRGHKDAEPARARRSAKADPADEPSDMIFIDMS
mmetsp:Transcript_26681/g.61395  ORF Transcript_26681/g.61395 Transcript_26681/m.61395 type:complete len:657 (-) Transcript_26681:144-2114(-)